MTTVTLFGKPVRVHEQIKPILETIDTQIREWSKTDPDINAFIKSLGTVDGYFWRKIHDTAGKSFHTFDIAIDILPTNRPTKAIYWNWEKQHNTED